MGGTFLTHESYEKYQNLAGNSEEKKLLWGPLIYIEIKLK
jgi:hypothetical protein